MSKLLGRTGLVASVAMLAAFCGAQYGAIRVFVNGQPVAFNDTSPRMVNGRVLVPLRGVFENMGGYVHWTDATETVDVTKGATSVRLRIGDQIANVNGQNVTLDVPPMLIGGSTMVPLRFVSEAMGADVNWNEGAQAVMITTNGDVNQTYTQTTTTYPPVVNNYPPVVNTYPPVVNTYPPSGSYSTYQTYGMHVAMPAGSVIPVTLDTPLSSINSNPGDVFTATVQTGAYSNYNGLPAGTRVEGHVAMVQPRSGPNPGVLQVQFDRLRFPNGSAVPIDGTVIGLDNNSVIRNPDGTLVVNPRRQVNSNQTPVYIGLGAGAGAVLGMITKGNVFTDALVGGALGYLFHEFQRNNQRPGNVSLAAGTQMGVQLNQPIMLQ